MNEDKPMSGHMADKAKLLLNQILIKQGGTNPDGLTITSPAIDAVVDTIILACLMRFSELQREAQMAMMKPPTPPVADSFKDDK